jgi:hypothetical protein
MGVAPAAAHEGFSDRLAEVPGDSFDVTLTTDGAAARRDLRRGRTLAVVTVDLGGTEDVLLVDGRADRRLRAAVVAQLSEVSRAYGRTLDVRTTEATGPSRPRAVWALFLLAGFGIAVVVSLLFGSVASSPLRGATRLLLATGLLAAGAAAAAVLVLPGGSSTVDRLTLAGTLVLVGLVSATITFAPEAVTGLGGLALAAGIFLVLAGPQLVSPSPHLLPDPWPYVSTVTPSGRAPASSTRRPRTGSRRPRGTWPRWQPGWRPACSPWPFPAARDGSGTARLRAGPPAAPAPVAGGTSQTLSVFRQEGSWWALSKRDEFVGTQVTTWRAPHPWGPFDGGTAVARLPSDTAKGVLRYMPLAHPGLLPRRGTVVVAYSRNRTDVDEVLADPLRYRPRFLRVTLPGTTR